jgi:hypothetical protein
MNKETIKKRAGIEECLICGLKKSENNRIRRGLCVNHYQQFQRALSGIEPSKQDAFEQMLIDNGQLLPSRQGQREEPNPFSEAAQQFMQSLPESDKKILGEAAKAEAKKKSKKPKG